VVIGSAYSIFRVGKNALQSLEEEKKTLLYWGDKNIRDGVVDMVPLAGSLLLILIPRRNLLTGKRMM